MKRRSRRSSSLVLTVLTMGAFASACSTANGGRQFLEEDAGSPPAQHWLDLDASAPSVALDGGLGQATCSGAAKQVFVVSHDRKLYRFVPEDLTFKLIGPLACNSGSWVESMAVDRAGKAAVLYSDGTLHKVDTTTARCEEVPYLPEQMGFRRFGMAFAIDDPASVNETLYVMERFGRGLAKLDTTSWKLTFIGQPGLGKPVELSGPPDAKLYAFAPGSIAEIDPATGKGLWLKYIGASAGTNPSKASFAMAFWGGSFWFFNGTEGGSKVTRYELATGREEVVIDDAGIVVVGAGASSCVPATPPK